MGAPLFDPDTGKVTDREALRSIQFNGQGMTIPRTHIDRVNDTKTVEVLHEDTGRPAGAQVEHGSGRLDAVVTPTTVTRKSHLPPLGE